MNLPSSLRYERKFRIDGIRPAELTHAVQRNPGLFFEEFPARIVNNIYFDTPTLSHYHDNIRGIARRTKVRIRWYGHLLGPVPRPVLEIKGKHGLLGTKDSASLPPLHLDERLDRHAIEAWLARAPLPDAVRALLRHHEPTLVNQYRRRYYRSADRQVRLTVDWDLSFHAISARHNTTRASVADRDLAVVEIKYADAATPLVDRITNALPFRMTRMSKYVHGLDHLHA